MANEFVARNGIIALDNSRITGSLNVSNNVVATSFTGSLSGTATTASYVLNAISASYALTSSGVQGGTANYIPLWTSATTLSSSMAYQTGSLFAIPNKLSVGYITTSSYTSELATTYFPTVNTSTEVTTANGGVRNMALSGYTLVTGAPSTSQFGGFIQLETSRSNANSFSGTLIGGDIRASHWGSGTPANITGLQALAYIYSGSTASTVRGAFGIGYSYTTGNVTQTMGVAAQSNQYGTGTITRAWGLDAFIGNRTTGTITNAIAVGVDIQNLSNGTITNAYGISLGGPNDVWSNSAGGTVVNSYGIYIASNIDLGSTSQYAIYSEATSSTYIKGNVGINKTVPVYNLDVAGSGNFTSDVTITGSLISQENSTSARSVVLAGSGGFSKSLAIINNNTIISNDTGSFPVWRCHVPCTASMVLGYTDSGSAVLVNAQKNGSNLLASNLSISTNTWVSSSTLQNQNFNVGDILSFSLISFSGSPKEITIQTTFNY